MKEGWEYKKLDEVCYVEYGTRVVQKKDGGTIYPVYGGGGETFRMDRFNRSDSIVIARFAMSKQCTRFVKGKFFLNDSGLTIRSKVDKIAQDFLNWHIIALNDEIYLLGKGMAQKNLDMPSFRNITLKIPPLSEQQHIVEELDLLSSIIEKKKAQLKELDNLAQSLFYEMFGNPISNEKGWDKNVLNEVAKVTSSKRILQSEWQEAGIPFYKVADIVNLINGECVTPLTFIKETTYNELKSNGLVPKANDVLITSRGTIGQCYIVKEHDSFYFQDGMITWLSNINSLISPTFLVALFANDVFSDSLKHSANSSTVAYISIKQLSNMKIPIPPLTLQQQFASKIEAIEHQKELIKQSIKEVETLFNSRMDYYFN